MISFKNILFALFVCGSAALSQPNNGRVAQDDATETEFVCGSNAASQPNKGRVASILYQIKDMPYYPELTGDSLYWALAVEGLEIVPDLIDMLDDTTETEMSVPYVGGCYAIGDISHIILEEIIRDIYPPTMDIIKSKKDYKIEEEESNYINYFYFVRSGKKNRTYLKEKLNDWFVKNKENLVWVVDTTSFGRSCFKWKYDKTYYPTKGYYKQKQ